MKRFSFCDWPCAGLLIPVLIGSLLSCERLPRPDFSFLPSEHIEAGDTIWFTNLSKTSYDFEWDFGDGNTSRLEDPKHVYALPGIYETWLTATNESGEGKVMYSIFVNDPTVLGFIIADSSGTRLLENAEVWIYTDVLERDNLATPLYTGMTNSAGIVDFHNLEPTIYHIWIFKEEAGGYWAYKGITTSLIRNRVNRFSVPCVWFANS